MWTNENRGLYDRSELRYPSDLTDAEWAKTKRVRGHLYRPIKQIVTARLDGDVLEWLKSHGRGYQSRMNAILRREMLSSFKSASAK